MKLHFLGGAQEVGASCTLIEIEGHRILVDAGIRMGVAAGSHLPNFSVLDDVGPPEEVLVTHAHTDHTGALPVLMGALSPGVPIRCTPSTQAITRVLLSDAVKIMAHRGEQDGELPLYPPEAAEACLSRMVDVPVLITVPICGGALKATWIPSGHILGAASIYVEGERESLLMTGDVSVANQQTIPGMAVPQCRPDVVVMESTYGNRQHADRAQQEAALAQRVAGVIEEGGKVLVPAFAVGRAQEVVLILSRAMQRGQIPSFPVFVDGMVRAVNVVYASFPEELSPWLRRRVERGEEAFYSEFVGAVSSSADRERVLKGPPCCIVASSGMLIGGASSFYAERMAGDAENLIAITGYQDEESPGRALLNLAREDATERVLNLNGKRVSVACRVETYSLSAHADAGELASLARRLSPRRVYLVHGDAEARASLALELDLFLPEGVHLPENGGVYTVEAVSGRGQRYGRLVQVQGISGERVADEDALVEVRAYVTETGMRGPFRVQELAEIWYGTAAMGLNGAQAFWSLLTGDQHVFEADVRRPYLYHVAEEKARVAGGPMEVNAAREKILAAFPSEAGLYKCGAHVEEGAFELSFHFPGVARERYEEQIRTMEAETGWTIRLRETPHQGRLGEAALEVVPKGAKALKSPAIRMEKCEVAVEVAVPREMDAGWDALAEEAQVRFVEETGYGLVLVRPGRVQVPSERVAPEDAWEVNRAYGAIRSAFEEEAHALFRVGLKMDSGSQYIEAAFITREVGARYQNVLDRLSEKIGWPIRVREAANQAEVAKVARQVTPEGCTVRGEPRFFPGESRVVVPVVEMPSEGVEEVREAFLEATGFEIGWEAR